MKLTKRETLLKHKELWLTVAKITREKHYKAEKSEALKCMGITEPLRFNCFCCEYTGTENSGSDACMNCPVKWPGGDCDHHCAHSLFGEWADLNVCEWEESAELAERIAHLADPELKKIGEFDMSFTKKDLRTGDIVTTRNGNVYMVMLGVSSDNDDILARDTGYNFLETWNDDLSAKADRENWDIMKVWRPKSACCAKFPDDFRESNYTLMFDRKDVKKMTVSEISKALGYDVEIIKEG